MEILSIIFINLLYFHPFYSIFIIECTEAWSNELGSDLTGDQSSLELQILDFWLLVFKFSVNNCRF